MPVQHRPELHVTAETGILNAPAGVIKDDDTWHVFYQFQPSVGAGSRWGHVYSDDGPFSWAVCDDALAPAGGEIGLRAGSVLAHHGGVDLYFTSVTAAGSSVQLAHLADLDQSIEVSDDGSAVDPHVQRFGTVVGDSAGLRDFRSPCVVRGWESNHDRDAGHEGWLMLAVTGEEDNPTPVILSSADSRDWTLVGALTFAGDHGLHSTTHLVAPRILRLRDEVDDEIYDVLLITVEGDDEEMSGYLVGTLDGSTFTVITGFTPIDGGYDFVRPRNTYYTPQTPDVADPYATGVIFGLLNHDGRADSPEKHLSLRQSNWANVLSLPRVLTLQGGRIFQTPYPGILDAVSASQRARAWVGLMAIPEGGCVSVDILDADGAVAARVTHSGAEIAVDRSMNPYHSDRGAVSMAVCEDDTHSMSIFVDHSTVEVFTDGGEAALASRVYIKGSGVPALSVRATGGASIEQSYNYRPLNLD
ncbi:glycoside hydrolase family 32 protein [Corynebacterium uterequi]|uniref:beta-fructofuranosidase n=1 Tax=Corynebacterium uterequi TaxID=1072256 RepID=A0A0G3HBQ9_9CORY|nr:GH32 C-terminal domain-containing protein [Corynebacterium uterequi]AKK10831.1 beta-fructosidase, levanase/invertase [Corynebacterium uterequi]